MASGKPIFAIDLINKYYTGALETPHHTIKNIAGFNNAGFSDRNSKYLALYSFADFACLLAGIC